MLRKSWVAVVGMVVIAGCTGKVGKDTAQATLSEYIARSFALKSFEDRKKLEELTTGEVKTALDKMTEQEFKHTFQDEKRDFISMKIRDERKLAEDRFSITYELTYNNKTQTSQDQVTNKKHALMVNEGGKWLISEVRNLKTFIEHQNELSF
jgi:hypothetical protein